MVANAAAVLSSPLGTLALVAWSLSFFYHFLNGIRHLFWDAGYGFELDTVNKSGTAVLAGTAILTVITRLAAF